MPTRIFIRSPDDILRCQSSSPPSSARHSILTSNRPSSHRLIRRRPPTSLSSKDISASSRLSGYLFIFTAYIVLFVSSMKFEQEENENIQQLQTDQADNYNLPSIKEWKRLSAIIGSVTISILMVVIISVHFDMVCAPNVWLTIFKDGSYGEGFILVLLILASLFMVYVSTSVSGIGGFVGKNYNVYFSSWIGFFACSYTLGLWRTSAMSSNHQSLRVQHFFLSSWSVERNTNYAWTWTLFFSLVTFFAILDIFLQDNTGEPLGENQIAIMLLSSSMSVLCCLIVLLMNLVCSHCSTIFKKLSNITEIVLLIPLIAFWSWSVFRFTGVNGLVNGPSNAYFGSWGCFFCSISTFGYWKVEYNSRQGHLTSNMSL